MSPHALNRGARRNQDLTANITSTIHPTPGTYNDNNGSKRQRSSQERPNQPNRKTDITKHKLSHNGEGHRNLDSRHHQNSFPSELPVIPPITKERRASFGHTLKHKPSNTSTSDEHTSKHKPSHTGSSDDNPLHSTNMYDVKDRLKARPKTEQHSLQQDARSNNRQGRPGSSQGQNRKGTRPPSVGSNMKGRPVSTRPPSVGSNMTPDKDAEQRKLRERNQLLLLNTIVTDRVEQKEFDEKMGNKPMEDFFEKDWKLAQEDDIEYRTATGSLERNEEFNDRHQSNPKYSGFYKAPGKLDRKESVSQRTSLSDVKRGLFHPRLPTYRRMEMDDELSKPNLEHCRTSTTLDMADFVRGEVNGGCLMEHGREKQVKVAKMSNKYKIDPKKLDQQVEKQKEIFSDFLRKEGDCPQPNPEDQPQNILFQNIYAYKDYHFDGYILKNDPPKPRETADNVKSFRAEPFTDKTGRPGPLPAGVTSQFRPRMPPLPTDHQSSLQHTPFIHHNL